MDEASTLSSYQNYAEFWNHNAQKIENIYKNIDSEIAHLEKLYQPFESKFQKIVELVEVLSSIYSGFNTIHGPEYLLRLKSVLIKYKKRYTRDSIDFTTIDFLMKKISDLFDESFNDFPALEHLESEDLLSGEPSFDFSRHKYRWITFRNNYSWFIIPFDTLEVYSAKDCQILSCSNNEFITVKIQGKKKNFRNLFANWTSLPASLEYFISIDDDFNYAVSQLGKTVYSKTNIITPKINPFKHGHVHELSPGRVKIFGKNHIYLYGISKHMTEQ